MERGGGVWETLWSKLNASPFNLPNNRIFDLTKLKAFVDDVLNVTKMMFFPFDRVEITVGIRENAGYQNFLFFPIVFSNAFFLKG